MAFIRQDIPAKFLFADTKLIKIELNFHKRKWFFIQSKQNNILNHLNALRKNLDLSLSEHEHVFLLGDSNVDTRNQACNRF